MGISLRLRVVREEEADLKKGWRIGKETKVVVACRTRSRGTPWDARLLFDGAEDLPQQELNSYQLMPM